MGLFNKHKEENEAFERARMKLYKKLDETEPGTDEYDKIQKQLEMLSQNEKRIRETRSRITKEGKGNLLLKGLGLLGVGGIVYGVSKFESEGNMFTGQKGGIITSLTRLATKIGIG